MHTKYSKFKLEHCHNAQPFQRPVVKILQSGPSTQHPTVT